MKVISPEFSNNPDCIFLACAKREKMEVIVGFVVVLPVAAFFFLLGRLALRCS